MTFIIHCIEQVYYFLWGDWIRLPLPGGTLSLPLLVLLLIPAGIYFTVRTVVCSFGCSLIWYALSPDLQNRKILRRTENLKSFLLFRL